MTAIVILNIVFATFVVVGILGLMTWGIASDRKRTAALSARTRIASRRAARRPSPRTSAALDAAA